MEINSHNIFRITEYIHCTFSKDLCSLHYYAFENEDTINNGTACLICYNIPVYPLILPCSHILCHNCYYYQFTINMNHNGLEFFCKCSYCRRKFKSNEAITLQQDIEIHPDSKHAKFYRETKFQCSNEGCKEIIELCEYLDYVNKIY